MKRLIIVEDEPYMADFLGSYIDWSKKNIRVEAILDNGLDGLKAIRELRPDIVITDIRMPQMDGITMIKSIIREGIDSKIIILSSHSEFHLVKEVFKLGIADYILKAELDEETLIKAVDKVINNISFQNKKSGEMKDLLYKKDRIKAFVFGTEKISECKLDLRITEKNLSVLVIRLLDYETVLKEEWNMEGELLKFGLMNVLEEMLELEGAGEFVQIKNDEFMVLLSEVDEKRTEEIAKRICQNAENIFGLTACCGYSGFEDESGRLNRLYNNAKCAADYTFIYGRKNALNYRDIEQRIADSQKINIEELILLFSNAIEKYDFEAAAEVIDKHMTAEAFTGQLNDLYEFYDMCCLEINKIYNQLSFKSSMRKEYKKIISVGTLRELSGFICNELLNLSELNNESVALIPRVKKYIDENYFKRISLESISEKFGVGYQKLSREFKKKTNKSLKKYLVEVRMNEAMKLITTSEYMLYEIAEMVGYANYENFSRMFYSHFKKWPSEIERS